MVLNGSLLNISALIEPSPTRQRVAYDTIECYGRCTIDKVRARNREMTTTEILSLNANDLYDWDLNTVLYAEFNDNLLAGNVFGLDDEMIAWDIYRKRSDEAKFTFLAQIPASQTYYIDHLVKSNREYQYRIHGVTSTQVSNGLTTNQILTDWYHYSIASIDGSICYLMDLNVQPSSQTYNDNIYVYENPYSEFPVTSSGVSKYANGSISLLCGDVDSNGKHVYPIDYVNDFKDFILNGENKIFKTQNGDAWLVQTKNFSSTPHVELYNSRLYESKQLQEISFEYIQVGEVNS